MEQYDFVSVGDITTDAFIKIKDAQIDCDVDGENQKLCIDFGAKIPYESVTEVRAVGNSPNAAVSAHRLGLHAALVTNVGDDRNGEDCISQLKENGISTDFVTVQQNIGTNYHYILWYEAERTILVKHHEYDYRLPDIGSPKWIYLSSLAENSLPYHHEIATYLREHPQTKLAFQPGTFQIRLGYETLKDIYEVSELFFCNKSEAQEILKTNEGQMEKLLSSMHERGPKIVVITDGPKGSYVYNGEEMWKMPMYPDPKPPVDRTGAGDSFSSTFTAMLGLGKSIPEALSIGPINSMSVVQYVGAQEGLLSMEQLQKYLAQAPAGYKAERIG